MIDDALRARLVGGMSVAVGTASPDGEPAACRAVGVVAGPAPGGLTVFLPVATAAETIANIASTGRLTITATHPVDHGAVQARGRSRRVRVAGETERPQIEAWLAAFAATLADLGMPLALTRRLARWPAFAVEVEVDAVFEQTPGPRAGALMKER